MSRTVAGQRKPPGMVYLEIPAFYNDSSRRFKWTLPFNKMDFISFDFMFKGARVYLFNCDEKELQDFLVAVLAYLLDEETRVKSSNNRVRSNQNLFSLSRSNLVCLVCALDRACLHLLTQLDAIGCTVQLGVGTKLVSFQNTRDIVKLLTVLILRNLEQLDIQIAVPTELLDFVNTDANWKKDSNFAIVSSRNGKEEDQDQLDSTEHTWHLSEEPKHQFATMNATVLVLHFDVKIDPSGSQANICNHADVALQAFLQFGAVEEICEHLCKLTILSLQVPTLEHLGIKLIHAYQKRNVINPRITQSLKQDRTSAGKPLNIDVQENSDLAIAHHYVISEDLLDVFNEKKLAMMSIDLADHNQYRLLDRALTVISKSLYIRKFILFFPYIEDNELLYMLDHFLNGFIKVAPTLIHPLSVTCSYASPKEDCHREQVDLLYGKVARIRTIIETMSNKNLQIIDAFVSELVLRKSPKCFARMLSVDLLRKLREMIID